MTSVFLPLALIALLGVFLRQLIPSMEDNRRAMNQMVLYEVTKSSLNLTIGAMIAIAHGTEEAITFRKTALEALKLPPVWALAAAIAWKCSGLPCPAFVLHTTALLATTVTGIMMLSLGMALKFKPTRLMALALPVASIKLLLSPVIVALAVVPLGVTGIYRDAAILEGAMPSQLLSFIIAGRFKLDEETMAFVIMVDTILAFVTLPLIHSFLR